MKKAFQYYKCFLNFLLPEEIGTDALFFQYYKCFLNELVSKWKEKVTNVSFQYYKCFLNYNKEEAIVYEADITFNTTSVF